ncbi:hypothetical protein [Thermoactinomyces mirandus]|uniref:hypothetical protein n=1 Tax=Thermoactinomyces mirandus TaxID=2756294 RepID=UPI0015EE917B|nr:hypothetical protein [Thermoactinomyces mirandus]
MEIDHVFTNLPQIQVLILKIKKIILKSSKRLQKEDWFAAKIEDIYQVKKSFYFLVFS